MLRDKIRGMIIGTAIGDALGVPAETWSVDKIRQVYPEGLTKYEKPDGHKWYEGEPAGATTDDTALTLATLQGLIDAGTFSLESQAQAAVNALTAAELAKGDKVVAGSGIPGWGNSTVEAIRRLANNVPYLESGKTTVAGRGTGNGTVMRVSPLAAYYVSPKRRTAQKFNMMVVDFSAMTHYTRAAAIGCVIHARTLIKLLQCKGSHAFNPTDIFLDWAETKGWSQNICRTWDKGLKFWSVEHLEPTQEDMWDELEKVETGQNCGWNEDKIYEEFGGGSCYVLHSLPFTYSHFFMDPYTIQTLYRTASAGGDTDSNASIVGGMLGALHGTKIFPKHLIDGLIGYPEIDAKVDEFLDKFKIK